MVFTKLLKLFFDFEQGEGYMDAYVRVRENDSFENTEKI
jgi:hypothetical protein